MGLYYGQYPRLRQFLLDSSNLIPWWREYIEGAMFTHRMLRYQARTNGVALPQISNDLVFAYIRDVSETIDPNVELREHYSNMAVRLSFEDWELGAALTDITQYRPNKVYIYGGARDLYALFRKQIEGQNLEKTLGFAS